MKPSTVKRTAKPAVTLSAEEIAFVKALVLYEDAEVLALNKPSGLSSQGGRGQVHTLDELLWAFARPGKSRPRLIHRLDRDTSGVILTAKTIVATVRPPYTFGTEFIGQFLFALQLCWFPLLISTVALTPKLTYEQASDLIKAKNWAPGEISALFRNALEVCQAGLDVPFSAGD